jgi:hypothetical protein
MSKLTTGEFRKRAEAVHPDKYDYSKVIYKGVDAKVEIFCKVHQEYFWQSPYCHVNMKQGCPLCGRDMVKGDNNIRRKHRLLIEACETTKECSQCKVHKPTDSFTPTPRLAHGVDGVCKECRAAMAARRRMLKRWLPIYQTHKICFGCNTCKPVGEFYTKNNSKITSRCKGCHAELRKSTKEEISKAQKKYFNKNKERINSRLRASDKGVARYETYHGQLLHDECPTNIDGVLFVKCKHCGKLFPPKNSEVRRRAYSIKNIGYGENHFYCSNLCKESCDVFNAVTKRKSERTPNIKARGCQISARKALIESQCHEVGHIYCEKCGDDIGVELHHTQTVKDNKDVFNYAGYVLLCSTCHNATHARCK